MRVSRVYTDGSAVGQRVSQVKVCNIVSFDMFLKIELFSKVMTESMCASAASSAAAAAAANAARIPPDGQVSEEVCEKIYYFKLDARNKYLIIFFKKFCRNPPPS